MPLHTFRYAACGGANMLLDIFLFAIALHFIFHKQNFDLGFFVFKPHIAAFLFAFIITFPVGFLLSKYIIWTGSSIKGRVQLFRYFLIVVMNLFFNYYLLKLFVEYLHLYPTISKILTTVIIVAFSYISQKHFTFKVKPAKPSPSGSNNLV